MTDEQESNTSRLKLHAYMEYPADRKAEFWISRSDAKALGVTAVQAANMGFYTVKRSNGSSVTVNWDSLVQDACLAKQSIPPKASLPKYRLGVYRETSIRVENETTLYEAKSLVDKGERPLALNFASGIHPGGGFLNGARAQEESLCRSSALYATLAGDPMYAYHAGQAHEESSDWAILSPNVPVFRSHSGRDLEEPWLLSFVTCAAPHGPSVGVEKAGNLLKRRIQRVLQIAAAYGYSSLVLGAWGCGAFGLDPRHTAQAFRQVLEEDFPGVFSNVVFAIVDWSHCRKFVGPFRDVFAPVETEKDNKMEAEADPL